MLFQSHLMGKKKHIWLSVSSDLRVDARRDLEDIGAGHLNTFSLADFDYSPIRLASGVIFTTYSSLISAKRSGRKGKTKTRLEQLLAWCGPSFDGCVLFDECHKAKNLGLHTKNSSKTGVAVFELQESLPNARIVYCSATGITNPADMAYMTRLGLWGEGTSFPLGFREFLGTIERGGFGMMELVAMHLKRSGVYHCRALSFVGTEFEIVENEISQEEVDMYNRACDLWQLMYLEIVRMKIQQPHVPTDDVEGEDEDRDEGDRKKSMQRIKTYFWGAHQRFFRSLCISLKVKRAIEMAQQNKKNGKSVIIGLQGTGEASLNEATKNAESLDDFISAPKRTLTTTIDRIFGLHGVVTEAMGKQSDRAGSRKCRRRLVNSDSDSFNSDSTGSLSDFVADSEGDDDGDNGAGSSDSDEVVYLGASRSDCSGAAISRRPQRTTRMLASARERSKDTSRLRQLSKGSDDSDVWTDENEPLMLKPPPRRSPAMTAKAIRGMRMEGWQFPGDQGVDCWVSKHCRRFYDGKPYDGTIVASLPAEENEGMPLWHLKHDDGDSEDLDEEEVQRFSKYFEEKRSCTADSQDEAGDDGRSTQTESSGDGPLPVGETVNGSAEEAEPAVGGNRKRLLIVDSDDDLVCVGDGDSPRATAKRIRVTDSHDSRVNALSGNSGARSGLAGFFKVKSEVAGSGNFEETSTKPITSEQEAERHQEVYKRTCTLYALLLLLK